MAAGAKLATLQSTPFSKGFCHLTADALTSNVRHGQLYVRRPQCGCHGPAYRFWQTPVVEAFKPMNFIGHDWRSGPVWDSLLLTWWALKGWRQPLPCTAASGLVRLSPQMFRF